MDCCGARNDLHELAEHKLFTWTGTAVNVATLLLAVSIALNARGTR